MIIIGICDDEQLYRAQVKTVCSAFFDAQKQEYRFVEFTSGDQVLAYQGEKIHLLFLDIEMPGTDGLEVLSQVRRNERIWRIVFMTSHKELKWETVDLKTLAFLEKPIDRIGVETCIKTVLRENRENIDISFKTFKGPGFIRLDRIVFIQAQGNYVNICTEKEEIPGYDSIKVIEEQTKGTTVIRTHKSYLANLQFVDKMNGFTLQMTNGSSVPIGRKYLASVKEAYFAFIKSITIDRNR
ncbi:MAG: response regulator transcription factor [Lachnospiraceae bacterium]|nr:response regulator transcription factor [Lachnospiraceae bacterium]MBR5677988.1 response regulator transcription factor [Paludibacteraceae bacterium]